MAPVVITGVLPPSGSAAPPAPSPRLEINDFIKNKKYFSLYVQALRMYPTHLIFTNCINIVSLRGIVHV